MIYLTGLKDFALEMLSLKTSYWNKKMRFFARMPKYRMRYGNAIGIGYENDDYKNFSNNSVILNESADKIVNRLNLRGYCDGISLNSESVSKLVDLCNESEFSVDGLSSKGYRIDYKDARPPTSQSIYRMVNPHLHSEFVGGIVKSQSLLEIAGKYLKASPVLLNSQIWYSFPGIEKKEHYDFGFHYDIDDYRFLKFFFYLDDVSNEHGPHMIIKSTHLEGSLFKFLNRRISEDVAYEKYSDNIIIMRGKAGQGFAEDTFCYHKGRYPQKRRLIFQVQFGITG